MFNHLILGGTFDHFHKGHELFVETALKQGKKVTIGLTTELLFKNKPLAQWIQSYELRKKTLADFILSRQKTLKNIHIIPLTNVYGNGYTDKTVDGIVVTEDTKLGGLLINKKRKEIGMKPLDIIVVSLVKGEDGQVISSERIRYGDIDKTGNNYYKWLVDKAPLLLPTSLRSHLREPLGDIVNGNFNQRRRVVKQILTTIKKTNPPMVFAIGDIIAESLLSGGYTPSVNIIDLRSRRKPLTSNSKIKIQNSNFRKYRNVPGTITQSVIKQVKVLRNRFLKDHKPLQLVIQGEEDLVALPAVLLAPLHSIVLYGQYDLGVVLVQVTEEKKKEVWQALKKFEFKQQIRV